MSTQSHGLKRVRNMAGMYKGARAFRSYKHSTTGCRVRRKRRLSLARRRAVCYRVLLFKLRSPHQRKLYRAQRQTVHYQALLFKLRSRRQLKQ